MRKSGIQLSDCRGLVKIKITHTHVRCEENKTVHGYCEIVESIIVSVTNTLVRHDKNVSVVYMSSSLKFISFQTMSTTPLITQHPESGF